MKTTYFENGNVSYLTGDIPTQSLPWNRHSQFDGVFLKHLIKGDITNGNISCHLVKVDPGCSIGEHLHDGKIEIHEVIEGNGICYMNNREIYYSPGCIALIPANFIHKVVAGNDGLFLLAKFSPALL